MASRTIILLEDDVDGSQAEETIEFGIDGTTYAIDLSDSNAKKLRGAFDGYISKARKVSGKRSTTRKTSSGVDSKRSVPGLPPTASSSPAAGVCLPRYSSSTGAPATKASLNQRTAPSAGRFFGFSDYLLQPGDASFPIMGFDHSRLTYRYQGLDQRLTGVEKAEVIKPLLA